MNTLSRSKKHLQNLRFHITQSINGSNVVDAKRKELLPFQGWSMQGMVITTSFSTV